MPQTRIDIRESGMSVGGMERLERLINEFGYTETTVVETQFGHIFLGERFLTQQPGSSIWLPGYETFWAGRDMVQTVWASATLSRKTRQQEAVNAAMGYLRALDNVERQI